MRKPIQIALAFAILTLVFAAGARVGQRQAEQRLAEQQQRRALEDVLWLLHQPAPEWFAYDRRMHPELDVALYPIYQTLNVDNGQWATAIGWVNLAGDERIASFVRGHLVDSWQSQVDRKIAELDVTTISSGLPFDQITRQLDLFLRQPSPELALWSAEKLAQLNALPSDHEQVLRRLLEDEQVRKNFAKPFESFLASKSSSTE